MNRLSLGAVRVSVIGMLLLLLPAMVHAQSAETGAGTPPIGQPLLREGALALKLQPALGLGTSEDEAEAESRLGEAGIAPKNGWIADYPVTPDIIGELQKAVSDAAEAGKLSIGKEEALKRLDGAVAEAGLAVKPHVNGETYEAKPADAEKYPNPTVIEKYYYEEGPPVVTYYAPPPNYYYLYSWVPYPFWWTGFWFPGFFVLNDFHRTVIVNKRVLFVSNHFNDFRVHRVFRIDPVGRFRGRTFAGIGVTHRKDFISTGVPRSDRRIFNGPRTRAIPGVRTITPSSRGGRAIGAPPSRGGRSMGAPPSTRGGRAISPAPRGGRVVAPSGGGGPRGGGGGGRRGGGGGGGGGR